jgi:RNA polymerase sigma-70 factor (ECF subfamily)
MTASAPRTIQKMNQGTKPLTILQRVAPSDKSAIKDCIDTYGNFIWALARKFTASTEEAETATEEIFLDIWRYAGRFDSTKFDEAAFIALVAHRRLIKRLQNAKQNLWRA